MAGSTARAVGAWLAPFRAVPLTFLRAAPILIAWFIAGETVRAGVLALAAPIGPESPLAALLLVPLAVLARLVSYIGMFLAVRPNLPAFQSIIAEGRADRAHTGTGRTDIDDILIASIVPFFTLYALIGGVQNDLDDYARAAYRYSFFHGDHSVLDVATNGPIVLVVIAIAFVGRVVIKRFGSRLPRWFTVVGIYLEATWVFVAVAGLSSVFADAAEWVENRQVVQWYVDVRQTVADAWTGFQFALDGLDVVVPIIVVLVLLPLAWLLIAGVISTRALGGAAAARIVPKRIEARMRAALVQSSRLVRHQARISVETWEDGPRPFLLAGRMIVRGGILHLGLFVFAYALLTAATRWVERGSLVLIGPHDFQFWDAWQGLTLLGVHAITEPLRVVLLALAFDAALGRWRDRRQLATSSTGRDRSSGSTTRQPTPR